MASSYYRSLIRLQDIASHKPLGIIKKGKKYIKPGQTPPKGAVTHRGPQGGIYYFVEDKHLKHMGKEHELVRSKGVTKDLFNAIETKFKAQGAESVHFVNVPGLEKNKEGKSLYNIYVNWGEKTQKKIADKKAADKIRYGHPKKKPPVPDVKSKAPDSKSPGSETPWETSKYKNESAARIAQQDLISQGKEVKVFTEWENKKGTSYTIMHRDKQPGTSLMPSKQATLTLNHNPMKRQAWIAKVEGHAPKWNAFIM
jgi:hypothetical protein